MSPVALAFALGLIVLSVFLLGGETGTRDPESHLMLGGALIVLFAAGASGWSFFKNKWTALMLSICLIILAALPLTVLALFYACAFHGSCL